MPDRENVIKELENYESYARVFSNIAVTGRVVLDALALLREQEPHLITMEDFVRADHYGYLVAWTEERNGDQFWKIISIRTLEYDKKRMRYWSSRPTNEQREAVKWE